MNEAPTPYAHLVDRLVALAEENGSRFIVEPLGDGWYGVEFINDDERARVGPFLTEGHARAELALAAIAYHVGASA